MEGLFDSKGFDAVFISHYHGDHMGLAYSINHDIPIYIGENSFKIIQVTELSRRFFATTRRLIVI